MHRERNSAFPTVSLNFCCEVDCRVTKLIISIRERKGVSLFIMLFLGKAVNKYHSILFVLLPPQFNSRTSLWIVIDQSITHMDICTCDPRPRPMDYKSLQFFKARKPSETLLHSCELCLDVCIHKTPVIVPTS